MDIRMMAYAPEEVALIQRVTGLKGYANRGNEGRRFYVRDATSELFLQLSILTINSTHTQ